MNMTQIRLNELLAHLPKKAREALTRAINLPAESLDERTEAFAAACAAVAFPNHPQIFPMPGQLTNEQRALAEILSTVEDFTGVGAAMPSTAAARRRWLCMEPRTILEEAGPRTQGEPLYRALQSALSHPDPKVAQRKAQTIFRRLSTTQRLAFFLARPNEYRLDAELFVRAMPSEAELVALGDSLPTWANAVALCKAPVEHGGVPKPLRKRLMTALASSGDRPIGAKG